MRIQLRGEKEALKKKTCTSCMGKKSEKKQTSLSLKGVLANGKRLTDLVYWIYDCRGDGIVREFGKVIYILPYSKWITNKDILYSTWNSTQGYVPAWMGGEFGGEWIHAYEFHGQRSQAGYSPWGRKQSDTAEWLTQFTYGWVPSLFTRNYHNIVNQLYPNTT